MSFAQYNTVSGSTLRNASAKVSSQAEHSAKCVAELLQLASALEKSELTDVTSGSLSFDNQTEDSIPRIRSSISWFPQTNSEYPADNRNSTCAVETGNFLVSSIPDKPDAQYEAVQNRRNTMIGRMSHIGAAQTHSFESPSLPPVVVEQNFSSSFSLDSSLNLTAFHGIPIDILERAKFKDALYDNDSNSCGISSSFRRKTWAADHQDDFHEKHDQVSLSSGGSSSDSLRGRENKINAFSSRDSVDMHSSNGLMVARSEKTSRDPQRPSNIISKICETSFNTDWLAFCRRKSFGTPSWPKQLLGLHQDYDCISSPPSPCSVKSADSDRGRGSFELGNRRKLPPGQLYPALSSKRPTHFVALRVDDAVVVHNIYNFQRAILRKAPHLKPCVINPAKLHMSLLIMCLKDEDVSTAVNVIAKAVNVFREKRKEMKLKSQVMVSPKPDPEGLTADKLSFDFSIIGTFGTRVLLSTSPEKQQEILRELHVLLAQHVQAAGLRMSGVDPDTKRQDYETLNTNEHFSRVNIASGMESHPEVKQQFQDTSESVDITPHMLGSSKMANHSPVDYAKTLALTSSFYEVHDSLSTDASNWTGFENVHCHYSPIKPAASVVALPMRREPSELPTEDRIRIPSHGTPGQSYADGLAQDKMPDALSFSLDSHSATGKNFPVAARDMSDELRLLYDKSALVGVVGRAETFYPHLTIMKTSQGLRRIKNRRKKKMLKILPEIFHDEVQKISSFGTQVAVSIDFLAMTSQDPDGYYHRLATFSLL